MPSPFPGMDPFLEGPAFWTDFHLTFVNYWREALADALPDNYEVSLNEQVYLVEAPPEPRKRAAPDVAVMREPFGEGRLVADSTSLALLEPVTIPLLMLDEPTEPYIEILHRPDKTLITVLELLSPTNKVEPGRRAYLTKRNAILRQHVNLVELDLLRGGRRLPFQFDLPDGDYYAFVCREIDRPNCDVFPWMLPDPLPPLPIPLRDPDADLILDMRAILATAFEKGRFGRRIDYSTSLPVPVAERQRAWLAERLSSRLP